LIAGIDIIGFEAVGRLMNKLDLLKIIVYDDEGESSILI